MGQVRQVLTFALAAILFQNAVAMYTDEDGVVLVTSETFDKHVLYPAGPALVSLLDGGSSCDPLCLRASLTRAS